MPRRPDVNGSIDPAVLGEFRRAYLALEALYNMMDEWSNEGMIITEVRFRGPELTQKGVMAVIKGIDESRKPFVAFRSGETVRDVLLKIDSDARTGELLFKEEKPYEGPGDRTQMVRKEAQAQKKGQ